MVTRHIPFPSDHAMFAIDIAPPPQAASAPTVVISEQWAAPLLPTAGRTILVDGRLSAQVAAVIAADPTRTVAANQQGSLQTMVYGSTAATQFARDFESARVPSCGGSDGLKFQPAKIGPVALGGVVAIPFLVAAAVRGKCLLR